MADAYRSDREDEQLTGGAADGVKVIVVVPEHLVDLAFDNQAGVVRDRICAVEMEYLQASGSGDGEQLARGRDFKIRDVLDCGDWHVGKRASGSQISRAVGIVSGKLRGYLVAMYCCCRA